MDRKPQPSPLRGFSLKNWFSKPKAKEEPPTEATPMCLGDEAKFRYDPVKKKYIFEGEPEEDEQELAPPPQSKSALSPKTEPKDNNDLF